MVEFDVIHGIDWIHACYASINQVSVSNEPVLEWKSSSPGPKGHFISYLKARKLVSKGCVYHLVQINNSRVETSYSMSSSKRVSISLSK